MVDSKCVPGLPTQVATPDAVWQKAQDPSSSDFYYYHTVPPCTVLRAPCTLNPEP